MRDERHPRTHARQRTDPLCRSSFGRSSYTFQLRHCHRKRPQVLQRGGEFRGSKRTRRRVRPSPTRSGTCSFRQHPSGNITEDSIRHTKASTALQTTRNATSRLQQRCILASDWGTCWRRAVALFGRSPSHRGCYRSCRRRAPCSPRRGAAGSRTARRLRHIVDTEIRKAVLRAGQHNEDTVLRDELQRVGIAGNDVRLDAFAHRHAAERTDHIVRLVAGDGEDQEYRAPRQPPGRAPAAAAGRPASAGGSPCRWRVDRRGRNCRGRRRRRCTPARTPARRRASSR